MTAVELARLKTGKHLEWQGWHFTYKCYSYRAHILKERDVPATYEYLSMKEIRDAKIEVD
ncbi:hypothetical protein EHM76_00610 [bacterium]|nr:MAG: hypothetical protein EHM76_00610 [bacterium]